MADPTLVQMVSGPHCAVGTTVNTMTISFLEGSQSGNCLTLVIVMTYAMTITSVVDDQSQTWTTEHAYTTGSNANGYIFSRKNTAANVKTVTITLSSHAGANDLVYHLGEYYNVDPTTPITDAGHNEVTSATTAWAHSAISPTAGKLVVHVAAATASFTNVSTAFTAGSGFQLEMANLFEGHAMQSRLAPGGSITPTITSVSKPYLSLAFALVPATAGAANPSACWIKRASGQNTKQDSNTGTTHTYQQPCDGTLQVMVASIVIELGPVTITSSSASYTDVSGPGGSSPLSNGLGGYVQHMYAASFTPSRTNQGVVTWPTAIDSYGSTLWFLDIVGAPSSPLDAASVVASTGTQSVAGNLTTHTVTPSEAVLLIDYIDHNSGSETGVTDSAMAFVMPYNGQDGNAGVLYTMDSGFAVKRTSAATTFTYTRGASAADTWEAISAGYKTGGGGAGPTIIPSQVVPHFPELSSRKRWQF